MSTLSFTILGTGDDQIDPSLVVQWKHHRLLFNCPEGVKRLSFEHKLHLAGKLCDIFVTRIDEWSPVGGMTELLMALDEVLAKEKSTHTVGIHGPTPLIEYIHATQPFFWRPELSIRIFEFKSTDNVAPYNVDGLDVLPVTFAIGDVTLNDTLSSYPLQRTLAVDFSQYRKQPAHIPHTRSPPLVTSYILTSPPLLGKFDVAKATALGVPKGPFFSRLVKGEEITLPDGKTVSPSDCVGPSLPGPVIIVLDCPTISVCRSIRNHTLFSPYFGSSIAAQQSLSIVHLNVADDVLASKEYSELVGAFGDHAVHFLVKEPTSDDQHQLYLSSEAFQGKLHIMAPEFFPLTYQQRRQLKNPPKRTRADSNSRKRINDGETPSNNANQKKSKPGDKAGAKQQTTAPLPKEKQANDEALSSLFSSSLGRAEWWKGKKINVARPLLSYGVLPLSSAGLESSKCDLECPSLEEIKSELPPDVIASLSDTAATSLDSSVYHTEPIKDDPRVTFLGTIAAQVSKYRGVSSIFVELPTADTSPKSRVKYMLLDTGDGCLAQLVRIRGRKEVDRILEDLSIIFISHKHGDHMTGITKLLSKVAELRRKRKLKSARDLQSENTSSEMEELKTSASNLALDDDRQCIQPHHICGFCKASFSSPTSVALHSFLHNPPDTFIETDADPEDPALKFATSKLCSYSKEDQPLLIIGSMWLQVWLQDFNKIEPRISYVFVDAELLTKPQHVLQPWLQSHIGIQLQTVRVIHSFPSYGVIIQHALSGKKIVYSGDTRPCTDLVKAAIDADLLIHEATFFDDMIEKALRDRHSTLSEAVDISVQTKAKVTILTHFSARFETAPPEIDKYQQLNENLIAAYDFLTIELNEELVSTLAKRFITDVLPRFKLAFPIAEDEQKKHKHVFIK